MKTVIARSLFPPRECQFEASCACTKQNLGRRTKVAQESAHKGTRTKGCSIFHQHRLPFLELVCSSQELVEASLDVDDRAGRQGPSLAGEQCMAL